MQFVIIKALMLWHKRLDAPTVCYCRWRKVSEWSKSCFIGWQFGTIGAFSCWFRLEGGKYMWNVFAPDLQKVCGRPCWGEVDPEKTRTKSPLLYISETTVLPLSHHAPCFLTSLLLSSYSASEGGHFEQRCHSFTGFINRAAVRAGHTKMTWVAKVPGHIVKLNHPRLQMFNITHNSKLNPFLYGHCRQRARQINLSATVAIRNHKLSYCTLGFSDFAIKLCQIKMGQQELKEF